MSTTDLPADRLTHGHTIQTAPPHRRKMVAATQSQRQPTAHGGQGGRKQSGEDGDHEGGGEVSVEARAATRAGTRAAVARGAARATMPAHLRKHRREAVSGARGREGLLGTRRRGGREVEDAERTSVIPRVPQ